MREPRDLLQPGAGLSPLTRVPGRRPVRLVRGTAARIGCRFAGDIEAAAPGKFSVSDKNILFNEAVEEFVLERTGRNR